MKNVKIVTSGTGIERASRSLINQSISDVVSISYTEMLLSKSGNSKYFDQEYIDDLDPQKNKRVVEFLKRAQYNREYWSGSLCFAPDINFFKLVLPQKHRDLIHSQVEDEDLTGWSKILSDVNKNRNILKSIISGLWGVAGIRDSVLNTLSISNCIERDPRVVQFFVGTPTNVELGKLSQIFRSLFPDQIIRTLSGSDDATNASSENLVKSDIQKCREEGKSGVIIISKDMGSRSFSVSQTDAVVLMYDNGSVSSLIQKISRALTGGLDYYGNPKKEGNVISLSLDPNCVDAVDIYMVEEAQKNKTKWESFISVVKRIRASLNIFQLDDNGDKVSLLDKDDYYRELIEKFSFEKLKNSQINIIPLMGDEDLRNSLLGINSSQLSKQEKKVKQLMDKGKKFLDSPVDSHGSDDTNSKEQEFEKPDINLIRQSILTINNSLLSIVAIDNSVSDKSKSFRSILYSIQRDEYKTREFWELYNISPSVVLRLLDKEVINERIIDVCLSKF